MSDMVERVARIIDPSSWRVMDSEKASMLRKYKGKNVGWPSDQFQHKESMAKAQEIIAAIQADAAPVAWMYERGSERKAYVERSQAALACGYAETALYAHPPVDNRVSTSSPVDDRAAPNTSGKLRDAVEVWEDAYGSYMLNEVGQDYEAAAAVIEADREAVRAEQAAELAKIKALAETLAGALDKLHEAYCADDYGTSEGRAFGRTALIETRKALRQYKEARDAS